jgi:sortase B
MKTKKTHRYNYWGVLSIVFFVSLFLVLYTGMKNREKVKAENQKAIEEIRKASQESKLDSEEYVEDQELPFISEIKAKNPDAVGWITVKDSIIDYPVVQGKDNEYYLEHDWLKNANTEGAVFMDYRNDPDSLNQEAVHTVLYGHNMKNGSMFHDLMNYKSEQFFYGNPIIEITDRYEKHRFEVFSAYVTDTDFYYIKTDFPKERDFEEFIESIKTRSIYKKDVELSRRDHILTLSTCTYEFEDARFVVHARKILD